MSEDLTQNLPDGNLGLILARLDSIDTRLDSMDKRFDSVDLRLDAMDRRLDSIDTRLTTLEDKVDRRLLETRPVWESVLEQLKEVNARLTRIEQDSNDLRRLFRAAFNDLARVQDNFEERLEKLEEPKASG